MNFEGNSTGGSCTAAMRLALLSGRSILLVQTETESEVLSGVGDGFPRPGRESAGEIAETLMAEAARVGRGSQISIVCGPGYLTLRTPVQSVRPCLPDAREWDGMPDMPRTTESFGPGLFTCPSPGEWTGPGHRLPFPGGHVLSGEDADLLRSPLEKHFVDERDDLDPSPFWNGDGIVIVRASERTMFRWALWLALSGIQVAERAGRPPPLIMASGATLPNLGETLGWDAVGPTGLDVSVYAPPGDPLHGEGGDKYLPAWEASAAGRLSAAAVDGGPGVCTVSGEGVSVHAIPLGCKRDFDPKRPTREIILLAAIGRDRILRGWVFYVPRPLSPEEIETLAREAWSVFPATVRIVTGDGEASRPKQVPWVMAMLRQPMVFEAGLEVARARIAECLGPERNALVSIPNRDGVSPLVQEWASTPDRRQFVLSHPAFVATSRDPEVTRLVDARRPVLARLCTLTGAPASIVRRLAATKPPYFVMSSPRNWSRVGDYLRHLGHGTLPSPDDDSGWFALSDVFDRISALLVGVPQGSVTQATAAYALTLPGRNWVERRESLAFLGDRETTVCRDLIYNGLVPWLRHLTGAGLGAEAWLGIVTAYGSPMRLHAAAVAWHDRPVLSRKSEAMPRDARWPVPFERIALPGGYAVALPSMASLVDEGGDGPDAEGLHGMNHCVASFGERCATGQGVVVSFREEGTGRRLSTLGLKPSDEQAAWRIAGRPYEAWDHSGPKNSEPSDASIALCEDLRLILAGGYAVDASALDLRPSPVVRVLAGDPVEVFPLWRPLLPRRWRSLDACGLRDLVLSTCLPKPSNA